MTDREIFRLWLLDHSNGRLQGCDVLSGEQSTLAQAGTILPKYDQFIRRKCCMLL